jgi:hypothetical protein
VEIESICLEDMVLAESCVRMRLLDRRRNEDVREELQIVDMNLRIEDCQIK